MRPKGTTIQLEVRRRVAVSLLEAGWGVRQVARHVKASPSSVRRWRDAVTQYAEAGLDAKPHPGGSQPKLSLDQRHHLIELLSQGARAHGFRNALWTLSRIASVIERHFGVTYCPSGVWHLMRRLKWSPQKPERRARERDEKAIEKWPTEDWPRIKKSQA
ncbi:MAG TPA: winged helix-turn-helix domain-containing protein [Candidatus Tectomicrobia bacterium]